MRFTKAIGVLSLLIGAICLAQEPFHNSQAWRAQQWKGSGPVTPGSTNCGAIHPDVQDWANRVAAAGGSDPLSAGTLNAVDCFYKGLIADSLTNKILMLNCVVTDDSEVPRVPLIHRQALNKWIAPISYTIPNVNSNGLTGDGANMCLDTRFTTVGGGWQDTSAGISIYAIGTNNMTVGAGGSEDSNTKAMYLTLEAGAVYFICWNYGWANVNKNSMAKTGVAHAGGFFSASRTAANAMAMYFGNSTNGFTTLTNATGTKTGNIFTHDFATITHGLYSEPSGPLYLTSGTLSFVCFHLGLTASETEKLYNRVQELRWNLGGGYR